MHVHRRPPRSNDPHVLAVAAAGEATVLFSCDAALRDDFRRKRPPTLREQPLGSCRRWAGKREAASRSASCSRRSSIRVPLLSTRKYSSMPQRASYQPTIRSAHSAVGPPSLDTSSHSSGSWPAGGSVSNTRTTHAATGPSSGRSFGGCNATCPILNSVTAVRRPRARFPPCESMNTSRPVFTGVSKSGCDASVRRIVACNCGSHTSTCRCRLAFARTTRPRLRRMLGLPLQQGVDVALPVPDHHHPRLRAGPPQRPALIEPPEPAPALLLPLRRRLGFRPRPRLQPAHPQRPPTRRERHRRMHEQAPRATPTLLKRTQTRRAVLQPRVAASSCPAQHRRCLPAALHQRLTVRLQDVLVTHLPIVQETVRRLLFGAAGEDRRQRLTRMLLPPPPNRSRRRRNRPSAKSERPNSRRAQLASSASANAGYDPGEGRRTPQRLLPPRLQTPQQHLLRLRRHRRPGRTTRRPPHAPPPRRPVARRRTRRLHAGLQQHRTNPVTR